MNMTPLYFIREWAKLSRTGIYIWPIHSENGYNGQEESKVERGNVYRIRRCYQKSESTFTAVSFRSNLWQSTVQCWVLQKLLNTLSKTFRTNKKVNWYSQQLVLDQIREEAKNIGCSKNFCRVLFYPFFQTV